MREQNKAKAAQEKPKEPLTAKQQYNVVTDTVTGVNFRLRDNLVQTAIVVVFVAVGLLLTPVFLGTSLLAYLGGAAISLVAGCLVAGILIMIYRAMKHSRGEHD